MSRQPRVAVWFAATFMLFFARAFMFSTWVSRGPEVKQLLDINTVQMGMFTMLYPVAGLLGINFASTLVQRYGSRMVAISIYALGTVALALLGPAITTGNLIASCVLLPLIGFPMAIADFVANYEGTLADKASPRSLFSAMHGAYGLGMMSAAALAGVMTDAGVGLNGHYLGVAIVAGGSAVLAGVALPKHASESVTAEERVLQRRQKRAVWRERRSLTIALVGFSFIMAEMAAGTWVPLALTASGFSAGDAAFALSLFWVVVTVMRLVGGAIVDAIGRYRTVLLSALVTAAGVTVFMLDSVISMPYLGLILWGAGMAVGFPMSVASMGDDPAWAAARINMIVSMVYVASTTVGPALGAVGQVFGIYVSFAIPVVVLLVAAALSPATKRLEGSRA